MMFGIQLVQVPVLLTLWSRITAQDATNRPHVIYILADDMGWNDVSFHGSDQIPTPNIDSLAYNGVILNNHYTQPVCTPSRAALMTGKYPIHTGQHWPLFASQRSGLPLSEKIMPEYFKEIGYATHLIGKWHLGFYKKDFTPLERGFDSHFGYWVGAQSYYDHITEEEVGDHIYNGYDMRRNFSVAWDCAGKYTTDLFTEEAVRLIENHPLDRPMLLLLTHLAVHAGNPGKLLEAPQEEINKFWYITDPNRRSYAAMVSKLDQSVGEVVEALGRRGMLRNSIIVFLSDNGAPNIGHYSNWGSNYPWRGQKATLWQGGIRTPCLVWSPLINQPARVSQGMMHVTDWLPTLLSAAGYKGQLPLIDGVDQWLAISNGLPSPRESVLIDIYDSGQMYGLIMGPFKYIKGGTRFPRTPAYNKYLNRNSIVCKKCPRYSLEAIYSSKAWIQIEKVMKEKLRESEVVDLRQEATITCSENYSSTLNCDDVPCVFNLITDPCEQTNISPYFPLLNLFMEAALSYYRSDLFPEESFLSDPEANRN